MRSRERVTLALNHEEPDRVPLDLGASPVTSMHVSAVYALRQALKLDPPETPVKVIEPYQMLGQIAPDLLSALRVDVVGLGSNTTLFGFKNIDWKPWKLFDGTPVLVPGLFNTETNDDGSVFMYPQGDTTVPPSARMPRGGFFFDSIIQQRKLQEDKLNVEDNLEEFTKITDSELAYLQGEAERLYVQTDKAILANFGGTSFGDIALVPGLQLKNPKGIRGVKEWYASLITRPEYVRKIFEKQSEIGLENLEKIYTVVGNRVVAVFVTGTDFGAQNGPILSRANYLKLFQPFHRTINSWIHEHTEWKTFIHSCGSVEMLINDFIGAGFDILNPVQVSAANMNPHHLKEKYGKRIIFWGGGVDTQLTLPFGTSDEVRKEVRERIMTLARGGGYVFNTIHNVQPKVSVENLLAMYETVREYGKYPIR